jgi:hypothetical protein
MTVLQLVPTAAPIEPSPQPSADDWTTIARSVAAKAKAAFCPILVEHGVVRVTIDYDGGGDEGQVHAIAFFTADNHEVDPPAVNCDRCVTNFHGQITVDQALVEDALDNFAYEALAVFHNGWENGEGACGEISIDTVHQSATLDHNVRVVELEHSSTEL